MKIRKTKYYKLLYLITPIAITIQYAFTLTVHPIQYPYNAILFTTWIIYYLFGLDFKRNEQSDKTRTGSLVFFWIISVALQTFEGYYGRMVDFQIYQYLK